MKNRNLNRFLVALFAAWAVCSSTGCQSFQEHVPKVSMDKLAFWKKKEVTDGSNAQKMIALWSENVAYGPEIGAKRGLGGRLYFYDTDNKPTKIDGELIVYAYDDENAPDATEPTRKYQFTEEEFQQFYSESEFGPSYSVWLAWDDVGNPRQSISLVPIFKSKSGKLLRGELSRSLLPGKNDRLRERTSTHEFAQDQRERSDIRRVSFTEDDESSDRTSGLKRTTIRMPDTMKRRIIEQAQASGEVGPRFQELPTNVRNETSAIDVEETIDNYSQDTAVDRIARLYEESKQRARTNIGTEDGIATRKRPATHAPVTGQYLGSQRPIRLRSE
ncbi:MAG: hypothetical protein KDB27_25895 [Planctomycetales bacterium]|nr:hypothetical protein [Planctomycetales bacterium]